MVRGGQGDLGRASAAEPDGWHHRSHQGPPPRLHTGAFRDSELNQMTTILSDDQQTPWKFKIFHDAQCPFCRLEVIWLMRCNRRGSLAFEDISASTFDATAHGMDPAQVHKVIHGAFSDGRIVQGVEVFRQAYEAVGLGWLVAPTRWFMLREIVDVAYALFAVVRVPVGNLLCFGTGWARKSYSCVSSRQSASTVLPTDERSVGSRPPACRPRRGTSRAGKGARLS